LNLEKGDKPKISIITVSLNSYETLSDCIYSVATQSYKNREHIIIDGASTDGTLKILLENTDNLFRFISEPDNGIYDAFNKGLRQVNGDVVGFLNADDMYASANTLDVIAKAFEDPSICAIYGDLYYVSRYDERKIIRRWKSSKFSQLRFFLGWMPPHPTFYVRKEWYEKTKGFDSHYKISADYFSILNLFSHPNFKTTYIPTLLIKMRIGGASNKSIKNIVLKSREDLNALQRSGVGGVVTLFFKNIRKLKQFF